MSLSLYGSITSPYVRRIRLFMEDMEYKFEAINIFEEKYREEFRQISPIKKLPVLIDSGVTIFDSHVIYHYLRSLKGLEPASIDESNLVSVIDAITDSNIILLMSKRSDLEIDRQKLLFMLQLERIPDSLQWLEEKAQEGAFKDWNFPAMCLLASMEWLEFREQQHFDDYPALLAARKNYADKSIVLSTRPGM